jgi:hypothetical protein
MLKQRSSISSPRIVRAPPPITPPTRLPNLPITGADGVCLVCLAAPLTLVLAGAVDKAASCYEQVVEFHNKLGSALEMAMAYKDAGGMYEKAEKPNGAPGRAGPCDWRSMCGGLADPCKLCRVLSVFGGGEEPVRARGSPVRVRQARQAPGRDLREGRDHRSYARLLPRGR